MQRELMKLFCLIWLKQATIHKQAMADTIKAIAVVLAEMLATVSVAEIGGIELGLCHLPFLC